MPLLVHPGTSAGQTEATWRLKMDRALIFHTLDNRLRLLTVHKIQSKGQKATPVIGPGIPLAPEDEFHLLSMLLANHAGNEGALIFPERLLSRSDQRLLWWVPSAVRPMHLRAQKGLTTIKTRWPSLVFQVIGRSLHLAALAEDVRPSATTPLFHAPLMNVYANSAVCTGDAKLPVNADISSMEGWESVIFDTAFTHGNWQGAIADAPAKRRRKSEPESQTVEQFWETRDAKVSPFPIARLNPMDKTLGDWMKLEGRD